MLYKLGLVGPVTASAVIVQTRFGLTVLDTADGKVRWQRSDVPAALDVFGDERHLFLTEFHTDGALRGVRAVRAADGASVPIPDAAYAYANKVRTLGRHILVSEPGPKEEVNLRLYDVLAGQDVWRKSLPKDSVLLDSPVPNLTATATPRGEISVFDLRTGTEIKRLAIKPRHMEKVKQGSLFRDSVNY